MPKKKIIACIYTYIYIQIYPYITICKQPKQTDARAGPALPEGAALLPADAAVGLLPDPRGGACAGRLERDI